MRRMRRRELSACKWLADGVKNFPLVNCQQDRRQNERLLPAPRLLPLSATKDWGEGKSLKSLLKCHSDSFKAPLSMNVPATNPPLTPPRRGTGQPVLLPSWEGLGVGSGAQCAQEVWGVITSGKGKAHGAECFWSDRCVV